MITKELLPHVKVSLAIAPDDGVAAATDLEGATLDMAGYDGVLVSVVMGAITANAVTGIVMQQSDNSDMSSPETLEAPAHTVADDDDNQMFVLDLFKPTKRYVRVHVDRATQNAVVSGATYTQYGGRTYPITSTVADTVTVASAISPEAA